MYEVMESDPIAQPRSVGVAVECAATASPAMYKDGMK